MSETADQIRFRCPACGRTLGVAARKAGRTVRCPACRMSVVVPEHGDEPRPGPSASSAAMLEVAADDGGFKLRRRRRVEVEEMDLTPMVDVTFLLLIFFMITASFSLQKTLEVPPPDPESQGASPVPLEQIEENSVVVRVEPGDTYLVDDRPVADPDDLPAALGEAMADGNRSELVIEADGAARHEAVVRVYDAGNEVGMQRIRLASPPPE
ncbi:MAG TPA: biopolymer transporter ExbD [Planctomycetaceae bacterium]